MELNFDWFFYPGDLANGQMPELDDSKWRVLDLPHDWSVEGEYDLANGTDWQSGYLRAGTEKT